MDWITQTPIAHRGLHGEGAPENSLPAFRAAIEHGYPIECDVQLTRDGVPIVFHDRELERLTGVLGQVADARWQELRRFRLDGTSYSIPRLGLVLKIVDGQVPLLFDLKNRTMDVGTLESAVIERLDGYEGRFAIQSFNPRTLAHMRSTRPDWPRGQVAGPFRDHPSVPLYQRVVLKRLLLTWWSRPDFIGYRHSALPYWPVSVHRSLDVPILAWTVRSEEDIRRVRPNAENVIFEHVRPPTDGIHER